MVGSGPGGEAAREAAHPARPRTAPPSEGLGLHHAAVPLAAIRRCEPQHAKPARTPVLLASGPSAGRLRRRVAAARPIGLHGVRLWSARRHGAASAWRWRRPRPPGGAGGLGARCGLVGRSASSPASGAGPGGSSVRAINHVNLGRAGSGQSRPRRRGGAGVSLRPSLCCRPVSRRAGLCPAPPARPCRSRDRGRDREPPGLFPTADGERRC